MPSAVTLRTLPSFVLGIALHISLHIEALQVLTDFATRRDLYGRVRDGAEQVDYDLFGELGFNLFDVLIAFVPLFAEEILRPSETDFGRFHSALSDEVGHVVGLHKFDQEHSGHMAWVVEVALVVFLLLEDVQSVLALLNERSHVEDLVFPFLLVVWGIRNLKLLGWTVVDTELTEFRETVFESNAI